MPTIFRDFDDYWDPFLAGQEPAPRTALARRGQQAELRELLTVRLPSKDDGTNRLTARAWAVQGRRSDPASLLELAGVSRADRSIVRALSHPSTSVSRS